MKQLITITKAFWGYKPFIFPLLLVWLAVTACGPTSKEAYLKKYEAFINEVAERHSDYSEKQWKEKDELFKKFTEDWYAKFKDDFTVADHITLTSFRFKYNLYHAKEQTGDVIKALFKAFNAEDVKKQLKYYVDNDMQSDVARVYDEAQKAGKEVASAVKEMLEEMKVNVDKLRNERHNEH
jgi:hypothetical protein